MNSEQKTSLDQIVAGDEVAFQSRYSNTSMSKARVERVTKTQIIINQYNKFYKKNGAEVGSASSWQRAYIYPLGAKVGDHTYLEQVEIERKEYEQKEREKTLHTLVDKKLKLATIEQLEEILRMLEESNDQS